MYENIIKNKVIIVGYTRDVYAKYFSYTKDRRHTVNIFYANAPVNYYSSTMSMRIAYV